MTYRAKLGAGVPAALLAGTLMTPVAYYFPGGGGDAWWRAGVRGDVEQELTDLATPMAEAAGDGYTIEFNGRDGYLTAPEGTDAESLAEDIAAIRGVRDVEIERTAAVVQDEPAEFAVSWGADGAVSGDGTLPSSQVGSIGAALGSGFAYTDGDNITLTDGAASAVEDAIPAIGGDLVEGSITVSDGSQVRISGVPADADALARLTDQFGDRDGVVLDVGDAPAAAAPIADPTPAMFDLAYDGSAWSQDGEAPNGLVPFLSLFGHDQSIGENLTVGNNVSVDISDARRFFGPDQLVEGGINVNDDQVVVRGRAASAEAAEAIAAAFDGRPNVTLEIEAPEQTNTQVAQAELDALLECCKIEFVTGTATPTAETEELIDRIAEVLERFPDVNVDVNGHTDSDGNDQSNQSLSEARATAVVNALIARGIDGARMTPQGFGESQPIADNETPEGRQTNRRVEIVAKEVE